MYLQFGIKINSQNYNTFNLFIITYLYEYFTLSRIQFTNHNWYSRPTMSEHFYLFANPNKIIMRVSHLASTVRQSWRPVIHCMDSLKQLIDSPVSELCWPIVLAMCESRIKEKPTETKTLYRFLWSVKFLISCNSSDLSCILSCK